MNTRIVTDSNAMLPAHLRAQYAIRVVPLIIVIDGFEHPEDTVDPVEFCQQLRAGAEVSTAAPAPGQFLAAYQELAEVGADAILSIHIGATQSATLQAARLAADAASIPVTLVDTGTASFVEGCCVWRAAEALATGGSLDDAHRAAIRVAATAASVFTIGELERANAGGRFSVPSGPGVPVFATTGPDMTELGRAASIEDAISTMVSRVSAFEGPLRIGVGDADAHDAADALAAAIRAVPWVRDVVRYTVGPSVAAHTGAGTFGAVYRPLRDEPA